MVVCRGAVSWEYCTLAGWLAGSEWDGCHVRNCDFAAVAVLLCCCRYHGELDGEPVALKELFQTLLTGSTADILFVVHHRVNLHMHIHTARTRLFGPVKGVSPPLLQLLSLSHCFCAAA